MQLIENVGFAKQCRGFLPHIGAKARADQTVYCPHADEAVQEIHEKLISSDASMAVTAQERSQFSLFRLHETMRATFYHHDVKLENLSSCGKNPTQREGVLRDTRLYATGLE